MLRIFIYIFSISAVLCYTGLANTQETSLSPVKTSSGVHSADFKVAEGTITVYLPSDLTVAENASGTVNYKSNTGAGNISQALAMYNLMVENQLVDINGNRFLIQVPVNLPTGVLSVTLQDKNGKIVNRAFFPVRLTKRTPFPGNTTGTANYRTPVTSRSGMPSAVSGPFNGDFSNSMITISGLPTVLLAESTRQLVFMVPEGLQGQKVLSIKEGGAELKTPFTILHVVKVGRDNPAVATRYENSQINSPAESGEILIESDEQFGDIDLGNTPDLGQAGNTDNTLSQNINKPVTVEEEAEFGPSINELSKPLELDPSELEKYNKPRAQLDYETNEFTSLKQFSDKPEPSAPDQMQVASKTPVSSKAGTATGSYGDINEVRTLLDRQINAPFTPLEASSETAPIKPEKPVVKSTKTQAETPAPEVASKKEMPPTTAKTTQITKPVVKSAPKTKPVAKAEPDTVKTVQPVTKKPVEPKPVAKPAPIKIETKDQEKPVTDTKATAKEVKPKPVETSKADSNQELKSKIPEDLKIKTDNVKKDTDKDNNNYKKINDLNSLNTKDSNFKSQNTQNGTKTKIGSNEKIKEEEYVSLKKKEIKKPAKVSGAEKGNFAIQLASFKKKSEASSLVDTLNTQGYGVYFKRFKVPGKGYWYRVRKGGFATRSEAEAYRKTLNLTKYHIGSPFVTVED